MCGGPGVVLLGVLLLDLQVGSELTCLLLLLLLLLQMLLLLVVVLLLRFATVQALLLL